MIRVCILAKKSDDMNPYYSLVLVSNESDVARAQRQCSDDSGQVFGMT